MTQQKRKKKSNWLMYQEFLHIAKLKHLLAGRQICILLAFIFPKHNLINIVI